MSSFGGPNIVTDGLVLHLDAGNVKSYQSGSTTWLDKSGYGNNGTLINGPTFNSANGGSLVFDGVDDYATIPNTITNNFPINGITVQAWVNHNNFNGSQAYINNWHSFASTQRGFILRTFNGQTFPSFWWCWGSSSGTGSYSTVYADSFSMNVNTWYHVVGVYEKGVSARIYGNGILRKTNTSVTNDIVYDTTNGVHIGSSNINSSKMNGKISSFKIYNRALTAQEVLQNYDATKIRFGL